ncbi:hypothetical protein RO3G_12383 [Rhizopus delemar RA 99-880]|uniref:Uncharacterized protein n=1 Tax=Rhizopus delemar (strain RA 99-880 / ATCC MYA-4621 / FGSC 9543 / NRRL 43880) TaxID=246409 RepID=I1CGU2_RHIO9|nr:hypothetical protein RO3G_12383 [Rhizopus delemar RA 99-880]|eukprot:EIE87672.1 hypothetical protein RO3G_12383 [Rhizopus delemar RA 99-880]
MSFRRESQEEKETKQSEKPFVCMQSHPLFEIRRAVMTTRGTWHSLSKRTSLQLGMSCIPSLTSLFSIPWL